MSLIELIHLANLGDERGQLISLESNKNIPIAIKRVYYLTGAKAELPRGFHAHKKLEQIAVCVSGRCRMIMDNGLCKEEIWLDSPSKAILIKKMIWHEMHDFSSDSVLLVLASEHYDEQDYIRSYDEFLSGINQ